MKHKGRVFAAVATVTALALTAGCGGSKSTNTTNNSAKAQFNAALSAVFNPSDHKGGTITMAISQDWDSVDPGDTYYGLSWNLSRLYTRSLVMFTPTPGPDGNKLIPDLADSLGVPSDGGKTWTYHLRAGVKFEDGTPVTSKDVKYGVDRSLDKSVLVNGPTYFDDFLDLKGYQGPYKQPNADDPAITTPDDRTIVFHLNKPFGGFDYFAMLPATAPVPKAKDTGANYKQHVVSTGPYMFASYQQGKGFTLKRNPNWDPATDPNRKALPDGYDIKLGIAANDIDNQLLNGTIQVDLAGTGVQSAALSKVLSDPSLKVNADNPGSARLNYVSINPDVAPLNDINCRKAVEYAADKTSYQQAYGGPFAGGDIATNLMPPTVAGFQQTDEMPDGADHKGDLNAAKAALAACGHPNGFSTNMSYRSDRPKEQAVAEGLQQALAKVGIKLTLKGYPTGDYFALYAGKPSFRDGNNLGLMTNSWGADWNDGFGFLQQIVDGRTIRPSGGASNLSVNFQDVNALVDVAEKETDVNKRNADWAAVDKLVMDKAVILPGVWSKAVTIRGKGLANVFVNVAFGQYDYLAMSVAG